MQSLKSSGFLVFLTVSCGEWRGKHKYCCQERRPDLSVHVKRQEDSEGKKQFPARTRKKSYRIEKEIHGNSSSKFDLFCWDFQYFVLECSNLHVWKHWEICGNGNVFPVYLILKEKSRKILCRSEKQMKKHEAKCFLKFHTLYN